MAHTTNRLLDSLPEQEWAALKPILTGSKLDQHRVLFDIRESIEHVYFPIDAVVSLVLPLSDGHAIEAAMVGHDGVVGASAVLNGTASVSRAVVQLAGACQHCTVNALKEKLPQCPTLTRSLGCHEQILFAHAQQTAACNVTHHLESRLARWLLRARDLRGSDELYLTQEYLAEMLGVGRTSVSIVAHALQQTGALTYRRGNIHITKPDDLKEMACECYEAVKLNYASLQSASNS